MPGRRWSLVAFLAALVTAAVLALAPVITTKSCLATSAGGASCTSSQRSLVASEGASVLIVLAVPVLITVVPVVFPIRRARLGAAVALTLGTFLGAASIGIFFLPTLVLAWAAVAAGRRQPAPA